MNRTLRVQVTATNSAGTSQALSAATSSITAPGSAPANTKQPDPSGTPQDGKTVSVDNGNWTGQQPITFSYQWQSCTALNSVCSDLAGATGQSYTVATSQIGLLLRATVTATNSLGKNSAFSNLTSAVVAKASAPLETALPTISGNASVGQTLQVSTGTWTGVASNGFAFQWSRCNANGANCASIGGATGESYGVGQADLGLALRATVTASNATGKSSATSAATLIAVKVPLTASFNAVLRQGQEVRRPHRTSSLAAGHFSAKVKGKTLTWTLSFVHLSGRANVATLNKGARAATGAAFKSLAVPAAARPSTASWSLTASPARRAPSGTRLREHPHHEKPLRRDPRSDQPRSAEALGAPRRARARRSGGRAVKSTALRPSAARAALRILPSVSVGPQAPVGRSRGRERSRCVHQISDRRDSGHTTRATLLSGSVPQRTGAVASAPCGAAGTAPTIPALRSEVGSPTSRARAGGTSRQRGR